MNREEARRIAEKIAWALYGTPYLWAGDDPMAGYDCSGFAIELLKSVGILPRDGDWTAGGLWVYFENRVVATPYQGCLAFWHKKDHPHSIVHIEFCLNSVLSIGASGGGSVTTSEADAIRQNAYVKIRPMKSRPRIAGFVDPFMEL